MPNPQGDAQANPQQAGQEGQPDKQTQTSGEPDYKVKFSESTREFQRLKTEWEDKERRLAEQLRQEQERFSKAEPILRKIADDAELAAQIEERMNEAQVLPASRVMETLVETKFSKELEPIKKEIEELRGKERKKTIKEFLTAHPGDWLDSEAEKYITALTQTGLPDEEVLQKVYELKQVDKARAEGKKEALVNLYSVTQAASSGGAGGATGGELAAELTPEEAKVAKAFKLTPEEYRKWKG